MKHAGGDALDALEPVLAQLRTLDGLKEKSRGTFYYIDIMSVAFESPKTWKFLR